jgi:hypothetical protein
MASVSVQIMNRHEIKPQPIQRKRLASAQGNWWRFDCYEIKDGSIQPAAGARLQWYDPWEEFLKTRTSNDIQPPYQSLLRLARELHFTSQRYPDRVTKASQAAILDWCRVHGPLGVLLSQWEAITLAPQAGEADQFTSTRYVRAFGQSIQACETSGDVRGRKPSVLLHGLNDLDLVEETPDKTWSKFFPSVEWEKRNTYAYPLPYTDEFCHLYAERLSSFCNAAQLFAQAVDHVTSARAGRVDLGSEQALQTINLWRRPISAILEWNAKGTPEQSWHTPSLLASFAEMFAQDVTFGRATLLCKCCQNPFVSGAYQARYCSPACRQCQQKRNVREKAKLARSLRAEGQTIRQIAAALDQKVYIVKGWLAPKAKR